MTGLCGGRCIHSKLEENTSGGPVSTYEYRRCRAIRRAVLTFVYTPHPVIGVSPETLSTYIAGNDPATGKPVIKEIIDLLTRPVSPKKPECKSSETARGGRRPALLGPDTAENWQRLFYENGWTDGLPVILPTAARVRKMLQGTGASPDEVVAEVFLQDTMNW